MSKYIDLYTENLIYISRTKLAWPLVLIRSLHTLLVLTNAVKCVAKEQNNFTESYSHNVTYTNVIKCAFYEITFCLYLRDHKTQSQVKFSYKFSAKFVKCLLAQEFLKQICIYKKTGLIALANYISYTCR